MKQLILLIFSLLLLPLVSANGLSVVNGSVFNINKTVNQDINIEFQLRNEEPFTFYNISFEDNDIVSMNMLEYLSSGETIILTAKVDSPDSFNGEILLKGFYETTVGSSYINYDIDVDFDFGLSECDKVLVIGDSITWRNQVNDEIKIKNSDTGQDVYTILQGQNKTTTFSNPETFRYSVFRRGFQFTDICTITVLDDTGMVNNPEHDTKIFINLRTEYEPTEVNAILFENNYSLDFYGIAEDVLKVENKGDKIAKDIQVEGDWFTFSPNIFDLNPGESRLVTYQLKPLVTQTNDTNKEYIKYINVTGNFDKVVLPVTIFIKYAEIGELGNYSNITTLIDIICIQYPEICNPEPRVVYRDLGNGTEDNFNVTLKRNQFDEWVAFGFQKEDERAIFESFIREEINRLSYNLNGTDTDMDYLRGLVLEDIQERKDQSSTTTFLVVVFVIILIGGLLGFIVFLVLKNKKMRDFDYM